jgi:hypothetical protein
MRGVEVVIVIPDVRQARIASQKLAAEAKPEGYVVEVYCWGWGRRPDGSVEVDLRGTIRSPPDTLERMPIL